LNNKKISKSVPFPRTEGGAGLMLYYPGDKTGSIVQMKEKDGNSADEGGGGPNQRIQLMQFPAELRMTSSQSNYQYEVSRLYIES